MRKGIAFFYLLILIAAALLYGSYKVPFVQEKMASITEEYFSEENIYSSVETLANRLDQEILNGSESFIVYLKNMKLSELDGINGSLDGVYGRGLTYQQLGMIGDSYIKVQITINKTINYYAMDAFLNGTPIPEDQPKAKELYRAISSIISSQIKDGMSDYEKELALHDYLVLHCRYSDNVNQDEKSDIYRAYGALVNQDAVCNGYAEAMHILLRCVGIESKFVVGYGKTPDDEWIEHAWNLVKLDGEWYHLDSTWDDPTPNQDGVVIHPYFNVTQETLLENHKWNQSDYPKAEAVAYNYYVMEKQYFSNIEEYKKDAYKKIINGVSVRYEGIVENYKADENDMQFVFEGNDKYDSVSWKTFDFGKYTVLVMNVE
ncbi:MAG: transglutaminase domain-containing protein [Lachnospiraceae bacterium]